MVPRAPTALEPMQINVVEYLERGALVACPHKTAIDALMQQAGLTVDQVDYLMFHQPNKFMLHKLADKMRVNRERMPTNIVENFGNASGATIPTSITFNLAKELTAGTRKLEDQLRSVLEIAAHTFTDDRVLVDPKISDAQRLSSARYTAYVRQSFERPDEHVYRLVNPATRETAASSTASSKRSLS